MPSVLIVDDHAGFRARARRLLEAEGWQVVGEAGDAADFADRLPASGACGFVPKGELSGAALSALLP